MNCCIIGSNSRLRVQHKIEEKKLKPKKNATKCIYMWLIELYIVIEFIDFFFLHGVDDNVQMGVNDWRHNGIPRSHEWIRHRCM